MKNILCLFIIAICSLSGYTQTISLLTPADEATNITAYPVFSWQLLGSSAPGLTYTFKIAEYNSSIGNAASLSTPLYSEVINDNSNFITYNYPTSLQPLDTCKEYVWLVTATYTTYTTEEPIVPSGVFNFTSDYFHFSTECSASEGMAYRTGSTPTNPIYIVPTKAADNFVYLVTTDSLYFKYHEQYDYTSLPYKIYNTSNNIVLESSLQTHYGLNYLAIDVTSEDIVSSSSGTSTIYTLELKTPKGEILRTKFEKKTL